MKLSFMTLILLAAGPSALVAQETPCGTGEDMIYCENGGECKEEEPADFGQYQLSDGTYHEIHQIQKEHHCDCKEGFTGEECEAKVATCNDGAHFCLHGGTCVPDGNYCDCSTAKDESGNRYVGKWCEHEEDAKYRCKDDFNFCLHNGQCNIHYPDDESNTPCYCDKEFEGPHCEFKKSQGGTPSNACDDIHCENGGICKLGSGAGLDDDFQDFHGNQDSNPEVYCDCPPGYHGEFCQVVSQKCGEDKCYNGGECVHRQTENGGYEYHCNCNTAGDELTKYVGKFCQYKSEVSCTGTESIQGHLFCTNGGTCNESDPYRGCNCPQGFEGFSCEYWVGTGGTDTGTGTDQSFEPGQDKFTDAACNLDCKGRGTCRKGVKDIDALGKAAYVHYLHETHSDDFEHCVCNRGFVGLQCEHEISVCGADEEFDFEFDEAKHFCMHGGGCIGNEKYGYSCDCSSATSDTVAGDFFTGDHCENPATSCSTGEETEAYCANEGICLNGDDGSFRGCDCADGWLGDRCETWAETNKSSSSKKERSGLKISMGLLFVFAVVSAVVTMAIRFKKRHRYFRGSTTEAMGNIPPVGFSDSPNKNLAPRRDDAAISPHSTSSRGEPGDVMATLESTQGKNDDSEEDGAPRVQQATAGDQIDGGENLDAVALSDDEII